MKLRIHFNRVNMQRGLPNVWTVHTSKRCYQGSRVRVSIPLETVFKAAGRQPRAYFVGHGRVWQRGGTLVVSP
jgi:hypothetical protein